MGDQPPPPPPPPSSPPPSALPSYAFLTPEIAARFAKETEKGSYNLSKAEEYWRDLYIWLQRRGYQLRPRYHPDWKPSWAGTNRDPLYCEDSLASLNVRVMDATRISDNVTVCIKSARRNTQEIEIASYLSEQRDPANHCVPILTIMDEPNDPEYALLFMPHYRLFMFPAFGTIGEVMECIRQTLEGLCFMHEHRVAHRDIGAMNVMMDAHEMYPDGYHPARTHFSRDALYPAKFIPRSTCNVRYYFIDFGLSSWFREDESPMVLGTTGRDKTIPELSEEVPYDAFKADVFALGNLYYKEFVMKYHSLDLIMPLINTMKWKDPAQRPTAAAAQRIFHSIYDRTEEVTLRWRLSPRDESLSERVAFGTAALAREGIYQLKRLMG